MAASSNNTGQSLCICILVHDICCSRGLMRCKPMGSLSGVSQFPVPGSNSTYLESNTTSRRSVGTRFYTVGAHSVWTRGRGVQNSCLSSSRPAAGVSKHLKRGFAGRGGDIMQLVDHAFFGFFPLSQGAEAWAAGCARLALHQPISNQDTGWAGLFADPEPNPPASGIHLERSCRHL